MAKIVKFTTDNMKGLWSIKIRARNELVRGLLDEALKIEFDCTDAHFLSILRELIEEYDAIKKDIVSGRIKDLPPELERLISNVHTVLTYLLQETQKEERFISEINISTYLTRLVQYTNDIVTKYESLIKQVEDEKVSHGISTSKIMRYTMIGLMAIQSLFALHPKSTSGDTYGNSRKAEQHKMEIEAEKETERKAAEWAKADAKKKLEIEKRENTKRITVEEINKAKKAAEIEKAKKIAEIAAAKAEEAARKANVPVPTPPGYNFMFAEESALITAYTPTGLGLMANGAPETGRTSTNFKATNNFDGVAVDPDLIPYGSLIYIEDVGWKIADDTGAEMRHSNDERGIVHIDIRTRNMSAAINLMASIGRPDQKKIYKKVYVFKNASDKNYYNRVWEARKGFKNPDSNLFKHISDNS